MRVIGKCILHWGEFGYFLAVAFALRHFSRVKHCDSEQKFPVCRNFTMPWIVIEFHREIPKVTHDVIHAMLVGILPDNEFPCFGVVAHKCEGDCAASCVRIVLCHWLNFFVPR